MLDMYQVTPFPTNFIIPLGLKLYEDNATFEYCCLQHFLHKSACIFSRITEYW